MANTRNRSPKRWVQKGEITILEDVAKRFERRVKYSEEEITQFLE